MAKKILINLINLYQKTLSLDHGWLGKITCQRSCRFTPSCSEYTKDAVEKYGITRGLVMGIIRITRCNPFTSGGFDPVK